ncbi:MAG: ATP phosphoribosyltransferase [Elusimicrobia bacterium]|nr:ATP phosphoribosyltransferase [Elusimicrobiota bacterium]
MAAKDKKLKFALPKGSLQKSTIEIFTSAGFRIYLSDERSYYPDSNDPEIEFMLIRPQEMSRYLEDGVFDAGLCGWDWLMENDSDVVEISELVYAKSGFRPVKWVLAVPEDSDIKTINDLEGKKVATELINFVTRYLKEKNIKCDVEFSWGATEVKPGVLCDAIVELTETGSSLRANRLRIVDEILSSTTRLIANKESYQDDWKRRKIDNISLLLQSAVAAAAMVGLKMNVEKEKINKIMDILPSLMKPTISNLTVENWVALEVVIEKKKVMQILPELKRAGAQGIIEYPLNKIVY